MKNKIKRIKVTRPDTACGYVGHMTAHELKEITTGSNFSASCPVCGMVHLNREEIEEIEKNKINESAEYRHIMNEAIEKEE